MSVVEEGGDGRIKNISVKLAAKRLHKFVKDNRVDFEREKLSCE